MSHVYTVLVAIAFALIGKSIGRYYAKTHLTDDTSAILTVAAHRSALKKVGRIAIVAFGIWLLMVCLSSLVAPWIVAVGWTPLVAMNCCLAILAGASASLAALLFRPFRWDAIQELIARREKLIKHLQRFVPPALAVAVALVSPLVASDACLYVIDSTPSVNAHDLDEAKRFLTSSVLEATSDLGCTRVVTIPIGCDVRHAKRIWLDVPNELPEVDCSGATPEPLSGHARFWELVRGVAESRKRDAVLRCEQKQEALRRARDADRSRFLSAFDSSLPGAATERCSRILPLIEDSLDSRLYRAIVVVTDAVDNPASVPLDIVVPHGTEIFIVLTRPNPAYASAEIGLARAMEWAKVPGVTVVTTAELRPGLWSSLDVTSSR